MSDDDDPVFRGIFFVLFALGFSYATIETVSEQRFEYGYRGSESRTVLTPTESPVSFWCAVAGQVAIATTSFAIAIVPLTPWGKARNAEREARRMARDARDRMLKKDQQDRKNEKRKKKDRRKRR